MINILANSARCVKSYENNCYKGSAKEASKQVLSADMNTCGFNHQLLGIVFSEGK